MRKKNWVQSTACVMCGEADETADHIFFTCAYTKIIWSQIQRQLSIHTLPDTMLHMWNSWRSRKNTTRPNELDCLFTTLIWLIWKERNVRIFRWEANSPWQILKKAINLLESWTEAHNGELKLNIQKLTQTLSN